MSESADQFQFQACDAPESSRLPLQALQPPSRTGCYHPWFGVSVRPRFEKSVELLLANKGYPSYLPVHRSRRQRSDRVRQVDSPVFPGYLFCRFDPLYRLPVITTPGVRSIVGLGRVPEPIPDVEIDAIQTMLQSGSGAEPWPYVQDGERVRITQGALAGLEGILVRKKSQFRLVVSVNMLQRSVATEIDQDWVSPIGR